MGRLRLSEGDDFLRNAALERQREKSKSVRDIGPIREVKDPDRRARCSADFRSFCEVYQRGTYALRWSDDHLDVINLIQTAVIDGGLFADAMPRGSGKTTLCESACVWAILNGHRFYIVLIGADASHAEQMLASIKAEIESNDLLDEDYPEVTQAIRALEGITKRCHGQTCEGESTKITWTRDRIVLPTIAGSKVSGSIIDVAGITGRIRGRKYTRGDGTNIRPDLVVVDDPQTDESANSPSQCATRERVLAGAVLGLAGPGKKIAGIMPCTVIRPHDLADRMLDRKLHPEWRGVRTKLVYSFPTNVKLWETYAEIRAESLQKGGSGKEATEFYRANRAAMDEGAKVAWAERFNDDELSAIQNAMNLKLLDEEAFFAEYQNEPKPLKDEIAMITPAQICARHNGVERGYVPSWANTLTASIDVQQDLLYYAVCGWGDGYSGAVIDYGTWPEQHRSYFFLKEANPTLQTATGIKTIEGSIGVALHKLVNHLLGRTWLVPDGGTMKIERLLIDANWGKSTDTIYKFCRSTPYSAIVSPSHGKYVGAAGNPMSEWPQREGERRGLNWVLRLPKTGRVRHVLFDTNFWKSFIHDRLALPMGEKGAFTLFGDKPVVHRLFADHLTAESYTETSGRGRSVDEWAIKPHKPDNHWFDCVVGCAVAAGMQGVTVEVAKPKPPKKAKVTWGEAQRRAEDARRDSGSD